MDVFVILYLFLLFENCIERLIPFLSYFDEIVTLLIFSMAIVKMLRNKKTVIKKAELTILVSLFLILILGGLGTLKYKIQVNPEAIMKDVIAISKFPLCYFSCIIVFQNREKNKLLKKCAQITRILIPPILICGLLNLGFNMGMSGAYYRFGFPSFKFLFSHETFLVNSISVMIAVLCADSFTRNGKSILASLMICILTLRTKAFIIVVACFVFYFMSKKNADTRNQKGKIHKKAYLKYIILIGIVSFSMAFNKIAAYIEWGAMAVRPALYLYGIEISLACFPLGSGFCTFASSLSGLYYSPLYYKYGFHLMIGSNPADYSYLGDVFWPSIYSQYGIFGFASYSLLITSILKSVNSRYRGKSNSFIGAYLILIYAIGSSMVEAYFVNVTGVTLAIILTIYLGNNREI